MQSGRWKKSISPCSSFVHKAYFRYRAPPHSRVGFPKSRMKRRKVLWASTEIAMPLESRIYGKADDLLRNNLLRK